VQSGYYQREIQKAAYAYQRRVDEGRQVVVGVNRWAAEGEPAEVPLKVDPALRVEQVRFLKEVKAGRNGQRVERALVELRKAASADGPLIEPILECVESYGTVGEISDVLRGVWGEYREQVVV